MVKIYLVGLSGVGKSTIGKELSSRLSLDYIDMDFEIEKQEGISISEIFQMKGEDAFRKTEMEQLLLQKSKSDIVISTGGGTSSFSNNMDWMLENGIVIYLQLPIVKIAARLQNSYLRPLLPSENKSELGNQLKKQLKLREVYYNKAHISFNVDAWNEVRVEELVDLINGFS